MNIYTILCAKRNKLLVFLDLQALQTSGTKGSVAAVLSGFNGFIPARFV
jgi:hypothetical protein